jgi:hypothetical protein
MPVVLFLVIPVVLVIGAVVIPVSAVEGAAVIVLVVVV